MAELNDKLITYGNLSTFHDNLINDSVTSGNSTWSSEKIASEIQQGGGGGGSATIENVTYAQLKAKRDNSQLVKGQQYRITDYVTMANSDSTPVSSAEHPFDLIVTAIDVNKLSETGVKAVKKANDDYFTQSGETMYRWKGTNYDEIDGAYIYTEERYFPNASAGTCTIGGFDGYTYYTTKYNIVGAEYIDSEYGGKLYMNPAKVVLYIDNDGYIVFGDSVYDKLLEEYQEAIDTGEEPEYTLEEIAWFEGKYFEDFGDSDNMGMLFDKQINLGAVDAELDKWDVKYCIDNDKTRFDWAQVANPGLGFSAIKVNGVKVSYYIDNAFTPANGMFGIYYADGSIVDNGTTYYKWTNADAERTVLTEQATYTNVPSGVDSDGCEYYNKTYEIVGEIIIDGEQYNNFYDTSKRIIKTDINIIDGQEIAYIAIGDEYNCVGTYYGIDEEEGEERVPNDFLYKRYSSGDTQDEYAWVSVKNTINKDINDKSVDWDDINIDDIIYTSSLTPSAGTIAGDFEVVEYDSNVQYIATDGKGVIYYLKDEWDNEVEYDFKNILFKNSNGYNFTFGEETNNPKDTSLDGKSNNNIIKTNTIDKIKYIETISLGANISNYTNKPKNIWCGEIWQYQNLSKKIDNMLYLICEQ